MENLSNSELYHQQRASLKKIEIYEALNRNPEVDASHVRVQLDNEIVILEGTAEDAKDARAMKNIVENIPGVAEVVSHLHVLRGTEI